MSIGKRFEEHQHKDEKPGPGEEHFGDGLTWTVRKMDPEELG